MHLLTALASGIVGAEDGTVNVYRRGTTTQAEIYIDFYGENAATNPVTLDGNGAVVLYTNELCLVEVMDSEDSVVRSFIDGVGDSSIEVISGSFTGVDYDSGVVNVNKPTTLRSVLDKWIESAGAPDFLVMGPDGAEGLSDLVSRFSSPYFNVKDVAYGAVGDGVVSDTAAVNLAIAAAEDAGGGIIYFPAGRYKLDGIGVEPGISFMGAGAGATTLYFENPFQACIYTNGAEGYQRFFEGFTLEMGPASTDIGIHIEDNDNVLIRDVVIIPEATSNYPILLAAAYTSDVRIVNCVIKAMSSRRCAIMNASTTSKLTVEGCIIIAGDGTTHSVTASSTPDGLIVGHAKLTNVFFDVSEVTTGETWCHNPGTTALSVCVGCEASPNAGGTVYLYRISFAGDAGDSFEEIGTILPVDTGSSDVRLMRWTPNFTTDPNLSYIKINSREGRHKNETVAANTHELDALEYATISLEMAEDDDWELACTNSNGVPGSKFSLVVYNATPNPHTVSFGSRIHAKSVVIPDGFHAGFEFVSAFAETPTGPELAWYCVGFAGVLA